MVSDDDAELGKIVGSNNHIDYICEIYNEGVLENPPDATDYEFGQFVYISKEIQGDEKCFIGVIYNTHIVDPDQGRTGPRLTQPDEQEIFQPTYVDEKQVLAGLALLGYGEVDDGDITGIDHSIPRWTLEVDDVVKKLDDEDMISFHTVDGEVKLEYYQRMVDIADGFAEDILSQILQRLQEEKPGEADALQVIQRNLEWQTKMDGV
jgi:hypothetical protein